MLVSLLVAGVFCLHEVYIRAEEKNIKIKAKKNRDCTFNMAMILAWLKLIFNIDSCGSLNKLTAFETAL